LHSISGVASLDEAPFVGALQIGHPVDYDSRLHLQLDPHKKTNVIQDYL
jgi:hypothetical protein